MLLNSGIRGYRHEAEGIKVLAYSDDIVFCVDKLSVQETVNATMRFCEISGANINFDQTRRFWLGAWALTPSVFANIHWNGAPARYLGVPLDNHRNSGPHWSSAITTI